MKKLMFLIPLMFLLGIFLVNAAGVDCNLSFPLTNGKLGNFSSFNVTYNASGSAGNVTAWVEGRSATTRNSSFSFVANATNTSNRFHVNITLANSIILEDSNDWEFRATCYLNASQTSTVQYTAVTTSATNTGILLDRTTPNTPTGITYTNPVQSGNTITATIARANTNRCFILFGSPTAPRKAMTLSGSTCTFTAGRDNPPNSDYQTYIMADDRTNQSISDVQSVTVRAVTSDSGGLFGDAAIFSGGATGGAKPFSKVNNNQIALILVLALAFLYFKNKKH